MARPLRIEFPGAVYHVTARGDRQEAIFDDDADRHRFLAILSNAMDRLDANAFAFCLMGNHYHLVLCTRRANLSRFMRHVNGEYTRAFNRRHGLRGHLFQGRFHAILVDRDAYLLSLCRYVELNPVRAGLADRPVDWRWSSFRAHVGVDIAPRWLDAVALGGHLLGRDVIGEDDQRLAWLRYRELAASGTAPVPWMQSLKQQLYLGDDAFVERTRELAGRARLSCSEIPRSQRRDPRPVVIRSDDAASTARSAHDAYRECGMTMAEIARQLDVSVPTVSRMIAKVEAEGRARPDTERSKT